MIVCIFRGIWSPDFVFVLLKINLFLVHLICARLMWNVKCEMENAHKYTLERTHSPVSHHNRLRSPRVKQTNAEKEITPSPPRYFAPQREERRETKVNIRICMSNVTK